MRLLPARHDLERVCAFARTPGAVRGADRRRDVRRRLPLRHLPADAESDRVRRRGDAQLEGMITSRRTFLKTAALTGASLVIGFDGSRLLLGAEPAPGDPFTPNHWVRIDPDGT